MIPVIYSRTSLFALTRILWVSGGISGVVFLWLALHVILDQRTVATLSSQSAAMETQLRKASASPVIAATKGSLPHGLDSQRILQAAVSKSAKLHHCDLLEFRAGTQISPYTPRYQKDMPEGQWSQCDAHFTLSGSLRNIMLALRALGELTVPIEIDTINLSRDAINQDGSTRLSAQIQLRAISEGAAR